MINILILVDAQIGNTSEEMQQKIMELLRSRRFSYVIATQFINEPRSDWHNMMSWQGLMHPHDVELISIVDEYANYVVSRCSYGCINQGVLPALHRANNYVPISRVFIAGLDTDCCVLQTAVEMFEHCIRPIVLTEYCGSAGGEEAHKAGLRCLKRLIGEKQLSDIKVDAPNEEWEAL